MNHSDNYGSDNSINSDSESFLQDKLIKNLNCILLSSDTLLNNCSSLETKYDISKELIENKNKKNRLMYTKETIPKVLQFFLKDDYIR
jgi:hypothetical protein